MANEKRFGSNKHLGSYKSERTSERFQQSRDHSTYDNLVPESDNRLISSQKADKLWEKIVKEPKEQKKLNRSVVPSCAEDETRLQRIADTALTPDSANAPFILQSVYGLIRKLGVRNRLASTYQLKHVPITSSDFATEGLAKSGYYNDLVKLGEMKFGKSVPEDRDYGWHFTVDYDCFSALGDTEVASCATSNIREVMTVRLFSKTEFKNRHPVKLVAAEVQRAIYGNQFMTLLSINKPGREQLCRGLNLDKSESDKLRSSALHGVVKKATGSNRITRYVKLWGYYFWLSHCAGAQDVQLPAVRLEEYTALGLSDVADGLATGGSTVMWVDKYAEKSIFLSLGLVEFPYFPLRSERGYCMFGGFSIPSEISGDGVAYILRLPGGSKSKSQKLKVTAIEAYKLICHYASSTQSYDDCKLGYVLAMALFTSTGLINFSLPKSQGLADMFAPMYGLPNEREVPPIAINKYALLGTMIVAHQTILMGKDMACYLKSGQEEEGSGTEIHDCLSNVGLRRAMYGLFRDRFFTPAFDLNYYIDPLAVADITESELLLTTNYTSVYWSVCSPSSPIRSSFMSFALSGYWLKLTEMASTDEQTLSTAVGVYTATGLIGAAEPDICEVDGDAILEKEEYSRLSRELLPGSFTMLPGIPEINLVDLPRPDFAKAVPIGRSEPKKEREIKISYKSSRQLIAESIVDEPLKNKMEETGKEGMKRKRVITLSKQAQERLCEIDSKNEDVFEVKGRETRVSEDPSGSISSAAEVVPSTPGNQNRGRQGTTVNEECIELRAEDKTTQSPSGDDIRRWQSEYPYLTKKNLQNQQKSNERYFSKQEIDCMPQEMYEMFTHFRDNETAEFTNRFDENRDGDKEFVNRILTKRVDSTGRSMATVVLEWDKDVEYRLKERRIDKGSKKAEIQCELYTMITGVQLLEWQEYQWRRILGSMVFNMDVWKKVQPVHFPGFKDVEQLQAKWYGFGKLPEEINLPTVFPGPLGDEEEFNEILYACRALEIDVGLRLNIIDNMNCVTWTGNLSFATKSNYAYGKCDPKMFVRLRRSHQRISKRDLAAEQWLDNMISLCRRES